MEKTVYIVINEQWDEVEGVFSTKEYAAKFIAEQSMPDDFNVVEFIVDELINLYPIQ